MCNVACWANPEPGYIAKVRERLWYRNLITQDTKFIHPGRDETLNTLLKICFVASCAFCLTACEPKDRRPGLWLSGEEFTKPVSDWHFTDQQQEIFLETHTWYGIPHSVTTVVATRAGKLYVPSLYTSRDDHWPDAKYWNRNVVDDARVRLKIDGKLYPRKAVLVTDAEEFAAAFEALARKYPFWADLLKQDPAQRPEFVIVRMDPRYAAP